MKSHLDEIENQLLDLIVETRLHPMEPKRPMIKAFIRTSLCTLIEKYGEEIIAVGDPSLNYTQHERFLLAKLEIAQRTKLKEILSNLK